MPAHSFIQQIYIEHPLCATQHSGRLGFISEQETKIPPFNMGSFYHALLPCSLYSTGEGNGYPRQCSCLENPRDRGAWWAAVHTVAQSRTRLKRLSMHECIGEGNGNPLQCSCLENPRNRGPWWAAIYGV